MRNGVNEQNFQRLLVIPGNYPFVSKEIFWTTTQYAYFIGDDYKINNIRV